MTKRPIEDALIAPHELRELISRLTEAKVEAIDVDHPRTLAAIAADTGIPIERLEALLKESRGHKKSRLPFVAAGVCLLFGGIVAWAMLSRHPQPEPTVRELGKWDHEGLVPINQVRYGPDTGFADPVYHPSKPLPAGMSISLVVIPIAWGAGDHFGRRITPEVLAQSSDDIKTDLVELMECVRTRAKERRMLPAGNHADPGLGVLDASYPMQLRIESSNGGAYVAVALPPAGEGDPKEIAQIEAHATEALLNRYTAYSLR